MKFGMYCVFNSKIKVCGAVDFSLNDEEAMKKFSDALCRLHENDFKALSSDLQLLKVADFDSSTCDLFPCEHLVVMCGDDVTYNGGGDVD